MNKTLKIKLLISLIESDINIQKNLIKDYEIKAKESLYYFGLTKEKKERIETQESILTQLKKIVEK